MEGGRPAGRPAVIVTEMVSDQATLVLISGLLSDEVVWRPAAEAFAAARPVVVTGLQSGDSFGEMARAALAATPGPLYVAGHSMGARVALEMVRLAPGRVAKLALIDTGVHPLQPGEAEKRQVLLDLAAAEGMAALAERWLPPMVHADRLGDDALMGALGDMVRRADTAMFNRQVQAMLARPDAEAVLAATACPVLLAVGRQDAWSPLSQHEEMRAQLKDARLVVIEEAGHFAPLEQPGAMIEALRMWIEGWDVG